MFTLPSLPPGCYDYKPYYNFRSTVSTYVSWGLLSLKIMMAAQSPEITLFAHRFF
jgi:hypothetical protein